MEFIKKYGHYAIMIFLTFAFGAAGLFKLTAGDQVAELFTALGLPISFGYFIAVSEIAGAIGIWLKPLRFWAALGFVIVCLGIIVVAFVTPDGLSHLPPAFILGLPALLLARLSFSDALFLKSKASF